MNVSVKVMKSFDYCHFEVQLASDDFPASASQAAVVAEADALGIEAQRLCDAQIRRYQRHKQHLSGANPYADYEVRRVLAAVHDVADTDRTPEMRALVKAAADYMHWRDSEFAYDDEDYEPSLMAGDVQLIRDQLRAMNAEQGGE